MELWIALFMYFLGMMLVFGLVEPLDDESQNAPIKLALTWPIVAVMYAWAIMMDMFYDENFRIAAEIDFMMIALARISLALLQSIVF